MTKGLYSVLLGDTGIANMTVAIPPSVFTNTDVRLRVWFNDTVHGFQQLSPDQRIAAIGYAMMAATVPNGAIAAAQLASNAVTAANLAPGAVTAAAIANGAVGANQLASNSVNSLIQSNLAASWVLTTNSFTNHAPSLGRVLFLARGSLTDTVAVVLGFPETSGGPTNEEWHYGLDESDGANDLVLAAFRQESGDITDYIRITTNGYIKGLGRGAEINPESGGSRNTLYLKGTNTANSSFLTYTGAANSPIYHMATDYVIGGLGFDMFEYGTDFMNTNGWDFYFADTHGGRAGKHIMWDYQSGGVSTPGTFNFGGNTIINLAPGTQPSHGATVSQITGATNLANLAANGVLINSLSVTGLYPNSLVQRSGNGSIWLTRSNGIAAADIFTGCVYLAGSDAPNGGIKWLDYSRHASIQADMWCHTNHGSGEVELQITSGGRISLNDGYNGETGPEYSAIQVGSGMLNPGFLFFNAGVTNGAYNYGKQIFFDTLIGNNGFFGIQARSPTNSPDTTLMSFYGGATIAGGGPGIMGGTLLAQLDQNAFSLQENISLNGHKISALGTPTAATDAATKGYVDGLSAATSAVLRGYQNMATNMFGVVVLNPNYTFYVSNDVYNAPVALEIVNGSTNGSGSMNIDLVSYGGVSNAGIYRARLAALANESTLIINTFAGVGSSTFNWAGDWFMPRNMTVAGTITMGGNKVLTNTTGLSTTILISGTNYFFTNGVLVGKSP